MKKSIILFLMVHALSMYSQLLIKEIKNINNYKEYSNAINDICNDIGTDLEEELKLELKGFNYHALIRDLKSDKKFNKLYNQSEQTITMTLLSKEYGIFHSFVTLSINKKTYIYSFDHKENKHSFVCCEKNTNSFLNLTSTLQDIGYNGLLLLVNCFPDNGAGIEVVKGLSLMQMQTLFYLDKFAKNIEK